MLRENSVLTDFIGFSSPGDPSCRHEDSAHDGGLAVSKPGSFREAQSDCLGADSRVTTAALRLQAQIEAAETEKQRSAVLVVDLKALERLEIRTDSGKARDRDPMEGEEVPGILEKEISEQARPTYNS